MGIQRIFFPFDSRFLCQFHSSGIYNSRGYHAFKCCAGYMDNYCCCYLDLNIDKALTVLKYLPFLLLISPHRPLWKCNILHRSRELDNVISETVPCLKNHVNTIILPAFSIHTGFRKFASWKTGKDRSRNGLKKTKRFIRKICQYYPESILKSQQKLLKSRQKCNKKVVWWNHVDLGDKIQLVNFNSNQTSQGRKVLPLSWGANSTVSADRHAGNEKTLRNEKPRRRGRGIHCQHKTHGRHLSFSTDLTLQHEDQETNMT